MSESVAVAKEADAKKSSSPTRSSSKSIHHVQNEPEMRLGSLGGVIGNIRSNGGKPSVESIATQLSGMSTGERAPALLALQQTHGNQYVQRVVSGIQAKLVVGQPGDIYEQEADRFADEVMRMPEPGVQRQVEPEEKGEETLQSKPLASQITPLVQVQRQEESEEEEETLQTKPLSEEITPFVQRQVEPEAEEEEVLQAKSREDATSEVTTDLESQINAIKGGGQPLSEYERAYFEPRFGQDFSKVRVHTDNEAAQMNQKLEAQAFTHRRDISFGAGQYNPQSTAGKRLLAHELTHTIQQGASPIAKEQSVQRSAYRTARQRGQSGNPINVAVQAVRGNYSGIGGTWLTTHLVAGIIYAEGEINTDVTDVIGDWLGTSGTVGPGQLSSAAIQQVDTSIPQAAHQQFETQFGAAPATWRERAEHDQWAFFYTAGYLAWCMSEAARLFQAVDGADSHIPLGFAYYQGAFTRIRDLRRRIAGEKGIANTDVTWEMIEEAAGRGASRRLSPIERRAFEYAQLGVGSFDFEFQINRALESRSFHVPEEHVKVHCSANYTDSSITPGPRDSYYVQLLELRTTGQGTEFQSVRLVRHDRVRFRIGQRQVYEWTGLLRGSTYAVEFTNENSNEISGSGEVEYLY